MKVIFQLKDYAQILIHSENSRLKVEKTFVTMFKI